jgi:hypothetical protein
LDDLMLNISALNIQDFATQVTSYRVEESYGWPLPKPTKQYSAEKMELGKLLQEKVENADIGEELFHLVSLKT